MGGNAAEVADFDMRVEKAALDDADDAAVADLSEITGLSGTFDSLASREIVSLPSASSSGVVPNLAMNWHIVRQGRLSFDQQIRSKHHAQTYQALLSQHQRDQYA